MDRRNLVPDVLTTMEEHVGDPEGMRVCVLAIMDVMEGRDWCMPAGHDPGGRKRFRTEKDDIDQEAEAVPDPPPP